jgi:hypothetical protein
MVPKRLEILLGETIKQAYLAATLLCEMVSRKLESTPRRWRKKDHAIIARFAV